MKAAQTLIVLLIFICSSCGTAKNAAENKTKNIELRFINEFDVPYGFQFQNTTVGGLSGIDRNASSDEYCIISDDRSDVNPARFYTARILVSDKGIDTVVFTSVHFFKQANGEVYPNSKSNPALTPDPEAIRFFSPDKIIWTSEGERILRANGSNVLTDPTINIADRSGNLSGNFSIPDLYKIRATENGPRRNGVFEGASFNPAQTKLFVNVEEPLYEDGPRAGIKDSTGIIRIIQFDVQTKKAEKEFAYQIDPVAHEANPSSAFRINGVPDILALSDHELIIVERSFSTGRIPCTIRVYFVDLNQGENVQQKNVSAVKKLPKKLLLNMDNLGIYTDNIEGVTLGPALPNGNQSLIFVSDDNFSKTQRTQFLLFEIKD